MQVLKPYTAAQRLMLAIGVDPYVLESHRKAGAINGKLPSSPRQYRKAVKAARRIAAAGAF